MTKQPRIIHCSYCLDEGHRINRCNDPSIQLLNEHMDEIAAIDWKADMNSEYLIHKLKTLSEPELHILGYKYNISSLTKLTANEVVEKLVDVYKSNQNTLVYIINNMNLDEIDYFANKLSEFIRETDNQNDCSLVDIRSNLYANHPANTDYNISVILGRDNSNIRYGCSSCITEVDQDNMISTNCNHTYCSDCIFRNIRANQNENSDHILCKRCDEEITSITAFSEETVATMLDNLLITEYTDCTSPDEDEDEDEEDEEDEEEEDDGIMFRIKNTNDEVFAMIYSGGICLVAGMVLYAYKIVFTKINQMM